MCSVEVRETIGSRILIKRRLTHNPSILTNRTSFM